MKQIRNIFAKGFTLIELLVVVMIIAILAAVAVPQYKRATLKARFSTVMPMAKAIADAQEVYYQGRQLYALDVDELDVTPVNAENTSVTLSQTDGYDYVMAQNSKVPGANYIIYQKYSENYPSEIHCEAKDDNADAQWLCGVLSNNNSIGETISQGYTTYLIKGSGLGISPWADVPKCDQAEVMGYTCSVTTNEAGEQVKEICTTVGSDNICRTKTYNEDGSYTSVTCKVNNNGVCTTQWRSATYDANGNQLTQRTCSSVDSNGNCTAYDNSGTNYTYDANGNLLAERKCYWINNSTGDCTSYQGSGNYDYTYDENGNKLTQRFCSGVNSNGICTTYGSSGSYDYLTHDANGNPLTGRRCDSFDSDWNCTAYSTGINYSYDANGNMLTERYCSNVNVNSNGSCNVYASNGVDYTYDANGNMLSQRVCGSVDTSTGKCRGYSNSSTGGNSYYTYDENGHMLTKRICSKMSYSGDCTQYINAYVYTYDDNDKIIATQYCARSSGTIDDSTGECISYERTFTTDM